MTDTGPAKLPGIPAYRTSDTALANTLQAMIERLEVREGARGNAAEKVLTQRDLTQINQTISALATAQAPAATTVESLIGNAEFANAVKALIPASSTDPNAGATESARVEATLRAIVAEFGFSSGFGYADGAYGKRWYIGPDMALKAWKEGTIYATTFPAAGPEYNITVSDLLDFLFKMNERVTYLEKREKEITAVSTQFLQAHEQRLDVIDGRLARAGL
jgi:hypothetical protein